MSISNISAASNAASLARTSEAAEAPGPDHDGDKDDVAAAAPQPVKAALPAGVGQAIDKVA